MKNTNEVPESYKEAVASGKIEYATTDIDTPSKRAIIRRINLLVGLAELGIFYDKISGEVVEALYEQVEKRIHVPSVPYNSLSNIEKRSFVDSIKGQTESIKELFPPAKPKIQHSDKVRYMLQLQKYYKMKKV
jgi:hypothetical protein